MQDSDDYFTDDIILDDEALAILDEEEQKFTLSTQAQIPTPPSPPAKRQKTNHDWKTSGGFHRRSDTLDDLEDLPEISVSADGSYGVHARQAASVYRPSNHAASKQPQRNEPAQSSSNNFQNALNQSSIEKPAAGATVSKRAHPPRRQGSYALDTERGASASISRPVDAAASSNKPMDAPPQMKAQIEALRLQMEEVRDTVSLFLIIA